MNRPLSALPNLSRRAVRIAAYSLIAGLCVVVVARGLGADRPQAGKSAGVKTNTGLQAREAQNPPKRGVPREAQLAVPDEPAEAEAASGLPGGFQPEKLVSPGGLSSTINLMILLTVLSLAPSILIMTTCFIRFIIVLGLLRQALGTQQLPPNQVLLALCLFLTFMVMAPVWQQSYEQGIRPYTNPAEGEPVPTLAETFENSVRPIRDFMSRQIQQSGNTDTLWMFLEYNRPADDSQAARNYRDPENYDEVPLATLTSAFMLSELKSAFVIGFQIFLPFLVIDMVVATVLMSMGMMMLPPTLISFPFKLLLFVLIDGWALTVGMLLESVRPAG